MDLISPSRIEPLIFKLLLTDTKYATLLGDSYEKEWMNDAELAKVIEVVIKYYKKHDKLPKLSTVELITSKLYPDNNTNILTKIRAAVDIDIAEYDRDFLDEEVIKYLRNGGIYWTIMSNVEEITKTHSVLGMIDTLSDLTAMSFDLDFGLDYFECLKEHCDELVAVDERLPTYWDEFDAVTNGGLYSDGKCFALFMGETHIGKSLMLSNIAANQIRNGKFVVIITLEMSEKVYGSRIDAHLSKVNINELKYNIDKVLDTGNSIKAAHPDAKLVIKEFPPDSISCNHIKNYLDRLSAFHRRTPDIIIVDYLNLLQPGDTSASDGSYNKYRQVATELRRLSYLIPKPVVSVVQGNRSSFNNTEISLDNVADSIAIPMVADFVGVLFQREGDREAEILNMKVLKNRLGGQIGKVISFHIDYSNLSISDIGNRMQCPNSIGQDIMNEFQRMTLECDEEIGLVEEIIKTGDSFALGKL